MHKYRTVESNFNKKISPHNTSHLQHYYQLITMTSASERKALLERQIADRRREEEERVQREAAQLAELEELARVEEEERRRAEEESRRMEEALRLREQKLRERLAEDARKKTEEMRKKAEAMTIVVRHTGMEAATEEPVAGSSTYQVKATDCLNCRAKKVECERPG